ncbi:MAG: RAD55 family ATPase, partial [Halobacteriales archaeon]
MSEHDYVETGVESLDSILGGGIVRGSSVLVTGNPGTGKTVLAMQFLYRGVVDHGEKGVYMTFEESREDLAQAAESLGFDGWRDYVDSGELEVYDKMDLLDERDFATTLTSVLDEVSDDYSRLVMDSLTMFEMFFETEHERRRYLLKTVEILKERGFTSYLVHESSAVFPDRDIGLEEFLTDGNIYLGQAPTKSGSNRYVWVPKMRKQAIDTHIFPMEIA